MKSTSLRFLLLLISTFASLASYASTPADGSDPEKVLWYAQPASQWEREALPIGNGRLGGMIFGGIDRERIQFNEAERSKRGYGDL